MKKLFTILCAALLSLGVSAQTESGNMIVGVNSDFNFSSFSPEGGGDSQSTMGLGGTYGYFFMDNLAGMASFDYSKSGDADASTSFGIGARYHMNSLYGGVMYNIGPAGDPSADGLMAFAALASALGGGGGPSSSDFSTIAIQAGYVAMLTDNISLEPSLSYNMHSFDGEATGSSIKLNVGFGLYF